jgi:hypothetical protein
MTRIDLHPEDLLERAARGTASDADWARLEPHLAECAVCRVERSLAAQAAVDAAPLRDEKLVVARLKREVAARLASPAAHRSKRKGTLLALALAAGTLASVAAAATLVIVRRSPAPQAQVASARPGPPPTKGDEPRSMATAETELAPPSVPAPAEIAPQPLRPAPPAAIEPASASCSAAPIERGATAR